MKPTNKLTQDIADSLSKHGVDRYCVIVDDPDSDSVFTRHSGSNMWRAGALIMNLYQTLREWDEEKETEDEA